MKRQNLLFFTTLLLWGCHKDSDTIIHEEEKPVPPAVIVTTKFVSILDTTQSASTGSQETFDGMTAPYSEIPYHVFNGQDIRRDYETATFRNARHLTFHAAPTLIENDVNYFHWQEPILQEQYLNTNVDQLLALDNDLELIIPANALLNADETSYAGDYSIHYSNINPGTNQARSIPSFQGMDQYGEVHHLLFGHCIYVAVISSTGSLLQFDTGARIRLGSSSNALSWRFVPENGIWQTAGQSDNEIKLDASGYYAIAQTADPVRVTGVLELNDSPLPHQPILITYHGQQQTVYTTNQGHWAAYIPVSSACEVTTAIGCGPVFTSSFQTNLSETFNVTLQYTDPGIYISALQGSLKDCNANARAGQYLEINSPAANFLFSESADFSFPVPVCGGASILLTALDPGSGQTSPSIQWDLADTIDVHSVFVCDQAHQEYLALTVAGEQKMYWDLHSTLFNQDRVLIKEGFLENDLDLDIYITGMMEGTYENTAINIVFEDPTLGHRGYSLYCPTSTTGCGFTTFKITHFPSAQGEWIRGFFEGRFWIKTFTPLTAGYRDVKGEFQVYREF